VTVAPEQVKVEYVRSYFPGDEKPDARNGAVAFSYSVKPRQRQSFF